MSDMNEFDKTIIYQPAANVTKGFRLDCVTTFRCDGDTHLTVGLIDNRTIQVVDDPVLINMMLMLLVGTFDYLIRGRPNKRVLRLEDLFDEFMRLEEDKANGIY